MENATKALLMAASILIGLLLFAILIYMITFVSSTTEQTNERINQKAVVEFNNRFLALADKDKNLNEGDDGVIGYRGHPNAISVQEFATLCNLKKDSNKSDAGNQVTIELESGTGNIYMMKTQITNYYLPDDSSKPIEQLFIAMNVLDDLELYYFTYTSDNVEYENTDGRISKITLKMNKEDT